MSSLSSGRMDVDMEEFIQAEMELVYEYLELERDTDELIDVIMEELLSSDDDEEERPRGGSREGKAPNKNRDFIGAYAQLVKDYFSGPQSVYDETDFERRFRMPRVVFNRIQDHVIEEFPFTQQKDCTGKPGIHPLCRLTACLRYLAYGCAYDREDGNLRISESALKDSVKCFNKKIVKEFGPHYLNRGPTKEEREAISAVMATRGFPGLFASWDCKHFPWKNCPTRLAGQHRGHAEGGKKTLILEYISDHRKYMWHVNFGDAGSMNDLNVLDKSSTVGQMLSGRLELTTKPYMLNGVERNWVYFLVDGIFPEWSIFAKNYSNPTEQKKKVYAKEQEKVGKDIECAFGIVVQQFQILQRPLRGWYMEDLRNMVTAVLYCTT